MNSLRAGRSEHELDHISEHPVEVVLAGIFSEDILDSNNKGIDCLIPIFLVLGNFLNELSEYHQPFLNSPLKPDNYFG